MKTFKLYFTIALLLFPAVFASAYDIEKGDTFDIFIQKNPTANPVLRQTFKGEKLYTVEKEDPEEFFTNVYRFSEDGQTFKGVDVVIDFNAMVHLTLYSQFEEKYGKLTNESPRLLSELFGYQVSKGVSWIDDDMRFYFIQCTEKGKQYSKVLGRKL